jgi:hypothetical protein
MPVGSLCFRLVEDDVVRGTIWGGEEFKSSALVEGRMKSVIGPKTEGTTQICAHLTTSIYRALFPSRKVTHLFFLLTYTFLAFFMRDCRLTHSSTIDAVSVQLQRFNICDHARLRNVGY